MRRNRIVAIWSSVNHSHDGLMLNFGFLQQLIRRQTDVSKNNRNKKGASNSTKRRVHRKQIYRSSTFYKRIREKKKQEKMEDKIEEEITTCISIPEDSYEYNTMRVKRREKDKEWKQHKHERSYDNKKQKSKTKKLRREQLSKQDNIFSTANTV